MKTEGMNARTRELIEGEVEALMLETFRPDEYFDKPKRDGQDAPEVAYLDAEEARLLLRKRP